MPDIDQLKEKITYQMVSDLVSYLDGQPEDKGDILVCRTICHHGHSHKLYYYENTRLFKCYTQCNDAFDIFSLVSRNQHIELPQAIEFVCNYFGFSYNTDDFFEREEELEDWKIFKNKKDKTASAYSQKVDLKVYSPNILKYFPTVRIRPWQEENIAFETIKKFNIKYDPSDCSILIPHYDINDNLIGIRHRTLVRGQEQYGKYIPAIINGKQYNHPLGFNLYGININKNTIASFQKAIVFESEKSVLQFDSYNLAGLAVATCGSNLTLYQVNMLKSLGVKQITIAFDKQWQNTGTQEYKRWIKKLIDIYHKYNDLSINFIYDKWDLLGYKDSPTDCGKDIFLKLYSRRIEPNGC